MTFDAVDYALIGLVALTGLYGWVQAVRAAHGLWKTWRKHDP